MVNPRKRALVSALICLALLAPAWWRAERWYHARLLQDQRAIVATLVSAQAQVLRSSVETRLAELQLPLFPGESALPISPPDKQAGVTASTPSTVPPTITDSAAYYRVALGGPFRLTNDGQGLIMQFAIYKGSSFVKGVYSVLDLSPLSAISDPAQPPRLSLALRDATGQVWYGDPAVLAADPVIHPILLPQSYLDLAGIPAAGWESAVRPLLYIFRAGTLALGALLAMFVYLLQRRRVMLELTIRERTRAWHDSRARYERLFSATPDALFVLDEQGHILDANSAASRSSDTGIQGLIGQPITEALAPYLDDDGLEALGALLKEPGQSDLRLHGRDGLEFLLEAATIPIATDNTTEILLTIRDETVRKRAEQELRARVQLEELIMSLSKDMLNLPPEHVDQGIQRALAAIGAFEQVDRSYVFLLSANRQTMSNTHEWCAPGITPQIANLQNLHLSEYTWWAEWLGRLGHLYIADVATLAAEASPERALLQAQDIQSLLAVPMIYGGQAIGFLGFDAVRGRKEWSEQTITLLRIVGDILADAVQRREAWEALRESEERYRQLIELSPNLVSIAQQDRMVFINSAGARMLGAATPQELLGRSVLDFVPPAQREKVAQRLEWLMAGFTAPAIEEKLVRLDGTEIDTHLSAVPLRYQYQGEPSVLIYVHDITQSKRVERALRESEERFRSVLDLSRDVIYKLNLLTGAYEYLSPSVTQTVGYTPAEVITMGYETARTRYLPQDLQRLSEQLASLARGDEPSLFEPTVEYRWLCKDGTYRWFSDSRTVTRDEQGKPTAMIGIARDITERKREEAQQLRNRQKLALLAQIATRFIEAPPTDDPYQLVANGLRELAEAEGVIVISYDPEHNRLIPRAVEGFTSLQEWTKQELGMSLSGRTYPVSPAILDVLRTHEIHTIEELYAQVHDQLDPTLTALVEHLIGDGSFFAIGLVEGEQILGVTGILMPRGEAIEFPSIIQTFVNQATMFLLRHDAQRALGESEARFRSLFENIGDAFILLNTDLQVVEFQDTPAGVLRLLPHRVIGQPFAQAFEDLAHDQARLLADLPLILHEGEPRSYSGVRLTGVGHDGADRYLDIVAYPVQLGEQPHVALLCRDVSETHRLQARVQQAERLEAQGRLASGAAHDFRHLMALIQGAAQLMGRTLPPNSRQSDGAELIVRATERGKTLARDLLAFSHDEPIQVEILHMNMLVHDAISLCRAGLDHRILLQVTLSEEALFFWGDEGQFQRIMVNLLSNALDAMPEGGVLAVETSQVAVDEVMARGWSVAPGLYALLVVRDTGHGISPESLEHIFEAFYTTRHDSGRTGLGLSAVYGMMQQHRGAIRVESQVGQGTSFYLYFPAVIPDEDDETA